MRGIASTILDPNAKPWQPTKRERKRILERARGRALQFAADWARKDETFLRDLRRLTGKERPERYRLVTIAYVGTTVDLFRQGGGKLDMRAGVKGSAFAAAAAWLSDPYRPDPMPVTPTQAKRAYYDALRLGIIEPPD